ncbi:MAG: hypothetical protein GDA48_15530 [Hormoscilla sp. GM102CHS1]|nr:hypothetical protein [Hormoscilla sp. GM102CHS1]
MVKVAIEKEDAIARISEMTEKLIASESFYQERLNIDETIERMIEVFDEFSTEELKEIGDEDIRERIDSILTLYAVRAP